MRVALDGRPFKTSSTVGKVVVVVAVAVAVVVVPVVVVETGTSTALITGKTQQHIHKVTKYG